MELMVFPHFQAWVNPTPFTPTPATSLCRILELSLKPSFPLHLHAPPSPVHTAHLQVPTDFIS